MLLHCQWDDSDSMGLGQPSDSFAFFALVRILHNPEVCIEGDCSISKVSIIMVVSLTTLPFFSV